jgi:hypothetical protein
MLADEFTRTEGFVKRLEDKIWLPIQYVLIPIMGLGVTSVA